MKLLVTGGAGFIGSCFVRMALNGDLPIDSISRVTVLDSLTYSGNLSNLESVQKDPRFEFVRGSINNNGLVRDLLTKSDYVVNFAAESHVDRSITNSQSFIDSNINGAHTLFVETLNSNVKRILHVSTDEVYGSIAHGSANEESLISPNSPYSASKASADMLARAFSKTFGLPVIVTRSSNNFGPFQFPEKLIPLFITNLIEGKSLPLYGDGKNEREWIYVEDNCYAIALALTQGDLGAVYNIGGQNSKNNFEVAVEILNEMEFKTDRISYVADRRGHDFRYAIDDSKIRALGFSQQTNFESRLHETIKWYRDHESWWRPLKTPS